MPRSIRDIAIILLLIAGGFLILFSAHRKPEESVVSQGLYMVMRPFQQAVFGIHKRAGEVWRSYVDLVRVREENDQLKNELRRLTRRNASLKAEERENRRLRKLLNLKAQHEFPSLVAQVIGEDAVGWYRTFFINRGSEDGVFPNMAVTTAEGVVGRIARISNDMAQVLLVTDPTFSLDCRIGRTRDRGVLSGSLDKGCVLRYIRLDSDTRPGDEVVTSGLDGVFPKGLPVGKIESVTKDDQRLFLEARVTPVVHFAEIEEVLVILGERGGFDIRPGLEAKP